MDLLIAVVVVIAVLILGGGLAFAISRLDQMVKTNQDTIGTKRTAVNPALSLGFAIDLEADADAQTKAARKLAAKLAASLPRGANMRIGGGQFPFATAGKGLSNDPWTAVKIAQFHGWEGAKSGIVAAVPAAPAAPAAAPAAAGKIDLVPGKDYPVIEITDSMSDAEKRKAKIANVKAKSAAMKAAKAAQAAGQSQPVAASAPAAVSQPAAPAVEPPQLIEITDEMTPDEKRKARVANAKANSAYKKALKAAGGSPAVAAPPSPLASAPPAAPANMPEPPQLIELSDEMSPDEKRKARVANAKAKSAYNKALKASGIDPKAAASSASAPASPAADPTPAAEPASPAVNAPPAPDLIEITEGMAPDEIRQARIANAKAKSAYKKALKDAGIDPKTIKI